MELVSLPATVEPERSGVRRLPKTFETPALSFAKRDEPGQPKQIIK